MNYELTSTGRRRPRLRLALLLALTGFGAALPHPALGAMTNVFIMDNFFSPAAVSIRQGDSVKWNWSGINSHSSTGPGVPALWDSGIRVPGSVFTNTFNTAGTFAYRCVVHLNQNGSVAVAAVANNPPSVSLTAPTNNSVFAAPWTGVLRAAASDSDGTVSKVEFYAGTTLLGTVINPPANPSFNITNLLAGSYALKAVATDNGGASNTSGPVNIQVLASGPISLSSPHRLGPGAFELLYSATPGLSYVVQRSSGLPGFSALSTNVATSNLMTYTDNTATGAFNVYSVKLQPNP